MLGSVQACRCWCGGGGEGWGRVPALRELEKQNGKERIDTVWPVLLFLHSTSIRGRQLAAVCLVYDY